MTEPSPPPILSPIEARVLAVLVEKQLLTPDLYPLTLHATVLACNQKTAREPVLALEPGEVGHTLRRLEDLGLVRVVHGSRALRYEHRFEQRYALTGAQRALLCALMLRGPQTAHELLAATDRLCAFDGVEAVREALERLMQRAPALVARRRRGSGQREDRYVQLLTGAADDAGTAPDADPKVAGAPAPDGSGADARLAALEARVAALEQRLARLEAGGPPAG